MITTSVPEIVTCIYDILSVHKFDTLHSLSQQVVLPQLRIDPTPQRQTSQSCVLLLELERDANCASLLAGHNASGGSKAFQSEDEVVLHNNSPLSSVYTKVASTLLSKVPYLEMGTKFL